MRRIFGMDISSPVETQPGRAFSYQTLAENDSTPLILLHPTSSSSTEAQCDLIHTTLSQCGSDIIDHFTALSYVWVEATDVTTLRVAGMCHNEPVLSTSGFAGQDKGIPIMGGCHLH
jgi:hypothetical protein